MPALSGRTGVAVRYRGFGSGWSGRAGRMGLADRFIGTGGPRLAVAGQYHVCRQALQGVPGTQW
jgi:hypothetical protein